MSNLNDDILQYYDDVRKVIFLNYRAFKDDEDAFQEGLIGVWKALVEFDESKGVSLRNYVIYRIKCQLGKYERSRKTKMIFSDDYVGPTELPIHSLEIGDPDIDEDCDPFDRFLELSTNFEDDLLTNIYKEDIKRCLTDREKDIIELLLKGYNIVEIGKIYGITKQRVHQIIKSIKQKIIRSKQGNIR